MIPTVTITSLVKGNSYRQKADQPHLPTTRLMILMLTGPFLKTN